MPLKLEDIFLKEITTNNILSDDELVSLRRYKEQALQELSFLESEPVLSELSPDSDDDDSGTLPQSIHRTPRAARERRRRLLEIIRAIEIATAPHKTLPAELLSYIFTLVFASPSPTPTLTHPQTPTLIQKPTLLPPISTLSTPLILTQTSSHWRSVALSTPALWSAVIFRQAPELDPYRTLEVVLGWFARAAGCVGLELEVERWPGTRGHGHIRTETQTRTQTWRTRYHGQNHNHDQVTRDILERLVKPYAARWRRISVWVPERRLWGLVKMVREVPFSGLCELGLGMDDYVHEEESLPPWRSWSWEEMGLRTFSGTPQISSSLTKYTDLFPFSPHLTSVSLHNLATHIPSIDTYFTPKSLTHFICSASTYLSVAQCHAIFKKCRALVKCEVVVNQPEAGQDGDGHGRQVGRPKKWEMEYMRELHLSFTGRRAPPRLGLGRAEDPTAALVRALFAPSLSFPALCDLKLEIDRERMVWPIDVVRGLIERSGCVLDGFQVTGGVFKWPAPEENANTNNTNDTFSSLLHGLTYLSMPLSSPLPRPVLEGIAKGTAMPHLRGLVCRLSRSDLERGVRVMERCVERAMVTRSEDEDGHGQESVCFVIEYEGVLGRELAVRIDGLRKLGARIEMTAMY